MHQRLMILVAVVFLAACGAQKVQTRSTSSSDLSSREVPDSTDPSTEPQLYCHQMTSSWITVNLQPAKDATNVYNLEETQVKISRISKDLEKKDGTYVRFFRWMAQSGTVTLDPNPLKFTVRTNSGLKSSEEMTDFTYSNLTYLADKFSVSGETAEEILDEVKFVLQDTTLEYDAIAIVMYQNKNALYRADTLLPGFDANPTDYADDNGLVRDTVLTNIHPYKSFVGSGNTYFEGIAQSQQHCF